MWHKGQTTGVKYNQFHWAAHSAPDRQEWYRAPKASRGDRHGSFQSLSWVSSCSEGYKEKVRTGFKVSSSKSRVCHHLFCSKWIFTWLQWILLSIITLFLWSALLFKAAAAFIHHLCYWLNVSWSAGGSSLVIIRHYGCILKAYSPLAAEARNGDVTSEARRF